MDAQPFGVKSSGEESEEEGGEKSAFPGLNKKHGFFHLIKRNQVDRDWYHQQQEERIQVSCGG